MISLRVDAVTRAIDAYAKKLHNVAQTAIKDATDAAEASARATIRATTTRHTGALERSWSTSWRGPYRRGVFNFAPYASYVDEGTRPHAMPGIPAKPGRTLRFIVGDVTLFRGSTKPYQHPGMRARPFTALASAAGQMAMKASAQAGLDRIAREF